MQLYTKFEQNSMRGLVRLALLRILPDFIQPFGLIVHVYLCMCIKQSYVLQNAIYLHTTQHALCRYTHIHACDSLNDNFCMVMQ